LSITKDIKKTIDIPITKSTPPTTSPSNSTLSSGEISKNQQSPIHPPSSHNQKDPNKPKSHSQFYLTYPKSDDLIDSDPIYSKLRSRRPPVSRQRFTVGPCTTNSKMPIYTYNSHNEMNTVVENPDNRSLMNRKSGESGVENEKKFHNYYKGHNRFDDEYLDYQLKVKSPGKQKIKLGVVSEDSSEKKSNEYKAQRLQKEKELRPTERKTLKRKGVEMKIQEKVIEGKEKVNEKKRDSPKKTVSWAIPLNQESTIVTQQSQTIQKSHPSPLISEQIQTKPNQIAISNTVTKKIPKKTNMKPKKKKFAFPFTGIHFYFVAIDLTPG
jgi:hypothetical protein